ncbi:MAG: hypothetical protein A2V66_17290 [Ignavibacteria bacterium RBG_13_36_8]|nr:MAG: hypothetical protein A2V66_17290 [Ignavibacteria bacterium RBG_13_36_8]
MKYFFFLFLVTVCVSYPQTEKNISDTDRVIIFHTYNYEFEAADKIIDEGLKKNPDSPKYYFLRIGTELIKSMKFRDDAEIEHKQVVTDSINNMIIPFAENAIEMFEDNTKTLEDKFFLGCIYGYLGRIYGIQRSWLSAFSYVKTGKNLLEEVLEEDPTYYDAYMVLGMFNYFADRMGGFIGIVASILGLSGDRDIGLDYLKIAQQKGVYTSAQATYILLELYSRLENNEFAAFPYFEEFVKRYPKNAHIKNWYCRELMDVDLINKVTGVVKNDKERVLDHYVMGRYYHRIGEYKLSNREFEYIKNHKEIYFHWYYDHAMFMYAVNNLMLDNRKEAENLKAELSENYKPLFDEMLSNEQTAKEITKLAELIGKFEDESEIKRMLTVPPRMNGNEKFLKDIFDFYSGVNWFKQKNYSEAEKIFDSLKSRENNSFTVESVKYLLEIYSITNVGKTKAERLVDFIDDMDVESLAYRAKDIEKKYKL